MEWQQKNHEKLQFKTIIGINLQSCSTLIRNRAYRKNIQAVLHIEDRTKKTEKRKQCVEALRQAVIQY